MQAADLKDILQGATAAPSLLSLTNSLPPLHQAPTLKPKLEYKHFSAKWDVVKYIPGPDQIPFYVWSKQTAQEIVSEIKPFVQLDIVTYTDGDYAALLTDPIWSRQETDYLFSLCKRFDLRFPVITDRYSFNSMTRSIEELRERYYNVVKRIKSARGEECGHVYDKAKEIERKKNLETLYSRTPEQAQEEEALYFELRKREATAARWGREREVIMEVLGNHEIPPKDGEKIKKKLKKGDGRLKKKDGEGETEGTRPPRNPYGVYLRSAKTITAKVQMQQKLTTALIELGIPDRPRMPTEGVMKKNDELRSGVISVLELKRQVDRLEHDIKSEDPNSIGFAARRTSNADNREKRRSTSVHSGRDRKISFK